MDDIVLDTRADQDVAPDVPAKSTSHDYLIGRSTSSDAYSLWRFDATSAQLIEQVPLAPDAALDRTHQIIQAGGYLLQWGPEAMPDYQPCYPYRLLPFDPTSSDPLNGPPLQQGLWAKTKFWASRADFGNPEGAKKAYDSGEKLMLVPFGNFVLNLIPTAGRGTHELWNFDPNPLSPMRYDPLPSPYTPQASLKHFTEGHVLLPVGNFAIEWAPGARFEGSDFWLWSFDPQSNPVLAQPALQQGHWAQIDRSHQLVVIGDLLLDWVPADRSYRLWQIDPAAANLLAGPLRSGTLPEAFDADTLLTGFEARRAIDPARAETPGTMDFMRSKIKHVVYLMVENRSFDHVCGWLYEKGETGINFIGQDRPFDGASTEMYNIDLGSSNADTKVFLSKYKDGKLSNEWDLDFLSNDPYHDNADVLRQMYFIDGQGYAEGLMPNMGGFVLNNGTHQVMMTYSPEQLPILNGLAREFAISDEWFASMPGATDANRAFSFTGSSLGQLNNFQNGTQYQYWPTNPHRPSMWKALWSSGFSSWKIYNSVEWMTFVHTYHLYLGGTIPSVDANQTAFVAGIDEFMQDVAAGTLPAFSFLEPVWISLAGTTSYHPGADLIPGERKLNEIYEALKAGPAWDETLFVVTFDEHGGLFDHVAPPKAENPWPNDRLDGFGFDRLGVRVPTLLISPWIERQSVFRSGTGTPYDGTSFLATLLDWHGIPRSQWGLGERARKAPSFESVFQRTSPRTDEPSFTPPYDAMYPKDGSGGEGHPVHDLHKLMAPRLVWSIVKDTMSADEANAVAREILANSGDLKTLYLQIDALKKKHNG